MKLEVGQFFRKRENEHLAKIVGIKNNMITIIDPIAPENSFRLNKNYYWEDKQFLKEWEYLPYYESPLWKAIND